MTIPYTTKSTTDSVLAELIDEVTKKLQAGETLDLEAYISEHPECAEQLRELVPTLELLADLRGLEGRGGPATTQPADKATAEDVSRPVLGQLGDFRILREVGRGGMGVVYEAEQISLHRRVALKMLPFAAVLDQKHLQRFKNEAQAAAALHHQNIVPVHGVGCERGVHYYAMQYIEGQTLAEVVGDLRRLEGLEGNGWADTGGAGPDLADSLASGRFAPAKRGPRPEDLAAADVKEPTPGAAAAPETGREPQAHISTERSTKSPAYSRSIAEIGIQVAEALDYAHEEGIVHRDIKPSNLILDARGKVWVTDFGLARMESDPGLTMTGDVLGTLRYMSPEQALAKRVAVDHRTDIYSLGVTLYELLTLQPAFAGGDRQELFRLIAFEEPRPPRRLNKGIVAELETIVLKAMAKNPTERYASAGELADDLRRFLEDKPIRARRPSPLGRARKWARRHRPIVWSAAVVLGMAAVVALGIGWNGYQRKVALERANLALERAVEQHLTAARALVPHNHLAARQRAFKALALLEAADYRGPLRAEVATVSKEVSAKADAEETFAEFERLRRHVHENMYNSTPNTVERVQQKCRAALELYRLFETGDWQQRPVFQSLDSKRQAILKEAVAELLFVWARQEVNKERKPDAIRDAHQRAIDTLKRIETCCRPIPAVYLWIAESHRARGEEESAEKADGRAKTLSATSGLDYFILGEFYHCQGQLGQALEWYAQARQRTPDHYLSLFASGLVLWELGRDEEAIEALSGAIAVNPRTILALLWRGRAYQRQGRLDLAKADFDRAEEIDPEDYNVPWCMAWLWEDYDDRDKAMDQIEKAVRLCPDETVPPLFCRGLLHLIFDEHKEAVADLTRIINWSKVRVSLAGQQHTGALSMHPEHMLLVAYICRATAYQRMHDLDNARNDLDEVTRFDLKTPEGYRIRAIARYHQGDFDKVIADTTEALRMNPKNTLAYNDRAVAHLLKGDLNQAIQDSTAAIFVNAKWGDSYIVRGRAHAESGDLDRAIEEFTLAIQFALKVFQLDPKLAQAYRHRGDAYRKKGDLEKALSDYSRAIELEPEYTMAHCNRALIHAIRGDMQTAQKDLSRILEIVGPKELRYADHLSGVAWFLANCPEVQLRNLDRAVELAQMAAEWSPMAGHVWTTLGAAQYRAGDWEEAVAALKKSTELGYYREGATGFFLAMAHWQLDQQQEAHDWYEKAVEWTQSNRPYDEELNRLRAEAAELLGIAETLPTEKQKPTDSQQAT